MQTSHMTESRQEVRSNKIKIDFNRKRLIEQTVGSCLMLIRFLSGYLARGPQVTRRLIIEGIKVEP